MRDNDQCTRGEIFGPQRVAPSLQPTYAGCSTVTHESSSSRGSGREQRAFSWFAFDQLLRRFSLRVVDFAIRSSILYRYNTCGHKLFHPIQGDASKQLNLLRRRGMEESLDDIERGRGYPRDIEQNDMVH